ncbi:MAG: nickel pincer cofactor biosynthesis protein LarC, partial [Armatimonadetes bacterium]|nr:nickel pincer cofactor biosynthesis protein LarC [Armatimonadota bacterium]
ETIMRIGYIEPVGGLSGDMFLGALVDAGVPLKRLERMLSELGLENISLRAESVTRTGITATKVHVSAHEHGHGHDHDHHHGRSAAELTEIVESSSLSDEVKHRAVAIIRRIAEAEARVHDTSPDEVHFHEVGGLDTVVDVCGAVVGLVELGVERLYCAPLPLGHGYVECAHGRLPLPAPATAELLIGAPTVPVDIEGETVTPTGAALAVALADEFGRPKMTVEAIGYGAGTSDFTPVPNVARLSVGSNMKSDEALDVVVIEANVDDMTPELVPHTLEAMLGAGALDAWVTPIVMKKGRPAVQFSALAEPATVDAVVEALLRETATLGVRMSQWNRRCVERETVSVETPWGEVAVKVGYLRGAPVTISPEYDDCARLAGETGVPLKRVYAAALAAAESTVASR